MYTMHSMHLNKSAEKVLYSRDLDIEVRLTKSAYIRRFFVFIIKGKKYTEVASVTRHLEMKIRLTKHISYLQRILHIAIGTQNFTFQSKALILLSSRQKLHTTKHYTEITDGMVYYLLDL